MEGFVSLSDVESLSDSSCSTSSGSNCEDPDLQGYYVSDGSTDSERYRNDATHSEARLKKRSGGSPESLVNIAAKMCVAQVPIRQLVREQGMPAELFPPLIHQAFRHGKTDLICQLLAHWPYCSLNLRTTRGSLYAFVNNHDSMCKSLILGLLQLRPLSPLRQLVLINTKNHYDSTPMGYGRDKLYDTRATRLVCTLPLLYLRHLSKKELVKMINEQIPANFIDAAEFLREAELPPFQFYRPRKPRKETITIVMPAVLEWLGKRCNYLDFTVGLALQHYVPFRFGFDKLVIKNSIDLNKLSSAMQLYAAPEITTELIIQSTNRSECIHVMFIMSALHNVLKRFVNLRKFNCEFNGCIYVNPNQDGIQQASEKSALSFNNWKHLQVLQLCGNLLCGRLHYFIGSEMLLTELNLDSTGLCAKDFKLLAGLKCVTSLEVLIISLIDLSDSGVQLRLCELFSKLRSLKRLDISETCITLDQATTLARHLQHLKSLTHFMADGNWRDTELNEELCCFLRQISKIENCKELDFYYGADLDEYVHVDGELREAQEEAIRTFAGRFGIKLPKYRRRYLAPDSDSD